ncbi:MAG TPA: hypothetical protein VM821_03595 [Abditibacteriaceae bacterium]|nr:hypothetical protein [Abditibacteriaceae bacterium]
MASKIKIADAGNVLVPAYLTLIQKGLSVRWLNLTDDPEQELWFAEDATREFVADGPLTLLGLVSLHEIRGDNWQASDEQIDDFLGKY